MERLVRLQHSLEQRPRPLGTCGHVAVDGRRRGDELPGLVPALRKIIRTRTEPAVDHREFYAFHQQAQYRGQSRLARSRRCAASTARSRPGCRPSATARGAPSTRRRTGDRRRRRQPLARRRRHDGEQRDDAGPARAPPGFAFAARRAATGTAADLYRVYVFSDSDCVNVIHRGSIVGSPAYVPRTTGSLKLPLTTSDLITASTSYLKDLGQGQTGPPQFMFDSAKVTSTESDPAPAKQAATPAPRTGSHHPGLRRAAGRRPSATRHPRTTRRCRRPRGRPALRRPLGRRLAERPLLLDGRARPLRDRRPEADARRRDRTWCEHLPPRRP